MNYSVITENYFSAKTSFSCIGSREMLYSKNNYEPTSSINPIIWENSNGLIKDITHIIDNGDLCVSEEFAQLIMSFDPYGIETYPAKLILSDGTIEKRYILALNNIIDVMDDEKSITEISPKRNKILVQALYLSEEKLLTYPLEKRILFRVKGAEIATFYSEDIYDLINNNERFNELRKIILNTSQEAPTF
ncbi:imm11 family protein [Aliivibrio fischeri]|uniref:imm11 family protein n=1 Tax=Aliivibrio fischeri TaxID=668 RepID=UPI001F2804E9|nr:DUF1629 domain-containing protein [Aliivibrio fischeri]MCE7557191.1 hypothetical protein [Aliivibrio fischeri]MCE7564461.1 hypothetical protein [Aliivibrio fischeri]MCE7568174.1 hypothetical protein [Aliivibrio fischeri]MCE7571869.1 hypothetical protein [Aliivibrio fischeri]